MKRLWPFQRYDHDLIETYLNDMAEEGYAMTECGAMFAEYDETAPREYIYAADYSFKDKSREEIKSKWTEEGWEYVDCVGDTLIFRSRRRTLCRKPKSLSFTENEERWKKLNSKIRNEAIGVVLSLLVLIAFAGYKLYTYFSYSLNYDFDFYNSIANSVFLAVFTGVMSNFDALFRWFFSHERNPEIMPYPDSELLRQQIEKLKVLNTIRAFLSVVIIALSVVIVVGISSVAGNAVLAVAGFVLLVAGFVFIIRKISKERKQINDIDYGRRPKVPDKKMTEVPVKKTKETSAKKAKTDLNKPGVRIAAIALGMIITVAVVMVFIGFDALNEYGGGYSQEEYVTTDVPYLWLEGENTAEYIGVSKGYWFYSNEYYSTEVYTGEDTDIHALVYDETTTVNTYGEPYLWTGFDLEPDFCELRVWTKESFEMTDSFDSGYIAWDMDDGTISELDENFVYVIYAHWEQAEYNGEGYYLFTIKK